MTSIKKGFTLVELLVVVGMIAIILGAMTTSVSQARERARIQKATADVKVITQAILASENWSKEKKLEKVSDEEITPGSKVGRILLGRGSGAGAEGGQSEQIPVLLMAQLRSGGKMVDPWGTPYRITIKEGSIDASSFAKLKTGFCMPNFYRLTAEER